MAILPNDQLTLAEVSATFGQDGRPLAIAELLTLTNPAFNDIPFVEANSTAGHKTSARQKLPETYLRRINQGVPASKSGYGTVNESMGLFAALGRTDSKLLELSGNPARVRMNENKGHIESMGQRFFQSMFYGDPLVTPEDFLGIAPRLDSLAATDLLAPQVIDAGGNDTDLTSIYLVGWGEGSVTGIYPRGSQAGIQHKDMGEELFTDPGGLQYPAMRDWFELDAGIAVEDYRNIVRIANIDVSLLSSNAATGANLVNLMVQAIEQLNNPDGVSPVFYVPRVIGSFLRQQITNKTNVWLSMNEVAGSKITAFDGYSVRRTDSISLNETRITV